MPRPVRNLLLESSRYDEAEYQVLLTEALKEPGELVLFEETNGWMQMVMNESSDSGRMLFRGKFQEANEINKNRRMYPLEVLRENVKRLEEAMQARSLYGELDHPTDSVVHLRDTSHLVTKLWWEGNTLMGEGEILNTPTGKCLQELMKAGGRIGISSRGVGNGTVNSEGVLVIGESYRLITFDSVADPSTHAAFQKRHIASARNETYAQDSRGEAEIRRCDVKSESGGLYSDVNPDALIALFGCRMEAGIEDLMGRLR